MAQPGHPAAPTATLARAWLWSGPEFRKPERHVIERPTLGELCVALDGIDERRPNVAHLDTRIPPIVGRQRPANQGELVSFVAHTMKHATSAGRLQRRGRRTQESIQPCAQGCPSLLSRVVWHRVFFDGVDRNAVEGSRQPN